MNEYMILIKPWAVYVKERDFFVSQRGHQDDWGKGWIQISADSIEHARTIGELKREKEKYEKSI